MRPRPTLALALIVALIVKVAMLSFLWKMSFSKPQAKKMRLPTEQVEQHLLSPVSPSLPPVEVKNAPHR